MELRASGSTIPHASPLIERADELRRIEAALELAESGDGSFVVVEGPAGARRPCSAAYA